jgi:autotransporter-associated beta strand protein
MGTLTELRKIFGAVGATLFGLHCVLPISAHAQNTVYFSTSAAGVAKSIAQWGADTAWPSPDNMRQSIANMGVNQIGVVRLNFYEDEPLQADGTLGPNSITRIDNQISITEMAGNKPLALTPDTGDGTNAYYLNGTSLRTDRWVQLIEATQQYIAQKYHLSVVSVEPFNEPDYWPGEGTAQDLNTIMSSLRANPAFQNIVLVGASTLNSDNAQSWYNQISGVANYGSTHALGGSANSYANFFQSVTAAGRMAAAPELHGLGEAIYAAEYGAQQGIWWGPVLHARGLFVQASYGKQLGYAENRGNDTVAAVYRAPDGSIRAFAGGFERFGTSTPYRFVSTSGPVYFNGVGPISQYMIQVGQGDDAYADIQTGPNPMPALDGNRWEIVNRQTGHALQVSGGSTSNGGLVNSATYTGALYQQWDITRNKDGYYAVSNANSRLTLDVFNWSTADGGNIDQWGHADNLTQQWYIQPAGNGYYYLLGANSNKLLTANTTNATQNSNNGSYLEQWQFVPVNVPLTGTLKAQYKFDGNANDSAGSNNGTVAGAPTYVSGPTGQGQAINLNGTNAYVTLPNGVANSSNITISAIVKWNGGKAWQRIFDFGNDTTSYMFLTPLSGSNTLRFAITTSAGSGEQILDTDPLPTGQWVQLAVTLSGNTGVLYENGKPIVAGQILLNPSDINSTLNYIGKSQYSADPLFSGSIDDFRIYNYALNQSQMLNLVPRRWTGALSHNWTTATLSSPKNWQVVGTATDYAAGDVVLFDDTASSFVVSVTDPTVSPSSTTFDNSTSNYVLNGPGAVAGTGSLTKNGTGALTINTSNTYSGGTMLNAGRLNINNASAIGTGTLFIEGAATIDNTSGAAVTLSTNNAQTWAADFIFGGSNPLNMGTGPIAITGNRTVTINGTGTFTVGAINESGGSWQLTKAGTGTLETDGPPLLPAGSSLDVTSGRLRFNVASGPVSIGTGISATIASGATLELAGSVSALANGPNRVNILNNSNAPGVLVTGTNQQVGNIDGSGTTQVNAGSDLTALHIIQGALVIGGTPKNLGSVTIDASDASGNPLAGLAALAAPTPLLLSGAGSNLGDPLGYATSSDPLVDSPPFASSVAAAPAAVPEPSGLILLTIGGVGLGVALVRRDLRIWVEPIRRALANASPVL